MKTWKIGESICFRYEDGTLAYGKVVDLYASHGEIDGYQVDLENDGGEVRVAPAQIVDWEQVSRDAGAALDRWHAEDRRKAGVLYALLGVLSYYASHGGRVQYSVDGHRVYKSVAEILAEYRGLVDSPEPAPVGCRYGVKDCGQEHPAGESECHCGCLNHAEHHNNG